MKNIAMIDTTELEKIAQGGLGKLSPLSFLEASQAPLPAELSGKCRGRLLILRMIILRQHFRYAEVLELVPQVNNLENQLPNDDIFMFYCESSRSFLHAGEESKGIDYLLRAQAILNIVSRELQDYWYSVLESLFAILWDDESRLETALKIKVTPDSSHFYYINHNPIIQSMNLVWAIALNGDLEGALVAAVEPIDSIRGEMPNTGAQYMAEVNLLHLRAMTSDVPNLAEFDKIEKMLVNAKAYQVMLTFYVAKAVAMLKQDKPDQAHENFILAFDYLKHHPDESRAPLLAYDMALPFYKERGDLENVISILEGRMKILEALRRRTYSLMQHLIGQAANLNIIKSELSDSHNELIEKLAAVGEKRDDATGQHTNRVSQLVYKIACQMELKDSLTISEAARLHDLGKVGLSDDILSKTGPLSYQERQDMQNHTLIGESMLLGSKAAILSVASQIARSHHERWDGMGYPDGLSSIDIPLPARIVAVADVYDALTSERPYKKAWPVADALREIRFQSGKQFDPSVVAAFEEVLAQKAAVKQLAKEA